MRSLYWVMVRVHWVLITLGLCRPLPYFLNFVKYWWPVQPRCRPRWHRWQCQEQWLRHGSGIGLRLLSRFGCACCLPSLPSPGPRRTRRKQLKFSVLFLKLYILTELWPLESIIPAIPIFYGSPSVCLKELLWWSELKSNEKLSKMYLMGLKTKPNQSKTMESVSAAWPIGWIPSNGEDIWSSFYLRSIYLLLRT